jgi:ATP-dependent Clp protease ATP-binding subunit ClpC
MKKVVAKVKKIMNTSFDTAKEFNDVNVRPEHILLSLLKDNNSVVKTLKKMGIDVNKLIIKIQHTCQQNITPRVQKRYNVLPLSKESTEIIGNAENECDNMGDEFIDLNHIMLSMLNSKSTISTLLNEFDIDYNNFKKNTKQPNIMATFEDDEQGTSNSESEKRKNMKTNTKTPVLDNFSKDITNQADEGKIDPVIGRDEEIKRVAQILSRRKKNNPVLIGDPGCVLGDTKITVRKISDLTIHKIIKK